MKSIKFVTACYILSFVAYHGPDQISTQTIARWVNTNASRVRQIVARLVRAGLLASNRGGEGGVTMGRAPSAITLLDIFDAVGEKEMALFSVADPFSEWKDRCRVHSVLTMMRGELEREFRTKLSATMLSQLYAPPPADLQVSAPRSATRKTATRAPAVRKEAMPAAAKPPAVKRVAVKVAKLAKTAKA